MSTATRRGTSNRNARGSAADRRRRRLWLVEAWRADFDVLPGTETDPEPWAVPHGLGLPACRCYRCGRLLTERTLEVDRIVEGVNGGTYRRNNIRPVCGTSTAPGAACNQLTGNQARDRRRAR